MSVHIEIDGKSACRVPNVIEHSRCSYHGPRAATLAGEAAERLRKVMPHAEVVVVDGECPSVPDWP